MLGKQSLRRPENWQDFEELCHKLWKEIWASPETQKNGRSGQSQNGVDIYGIPRGEAQYYGIQCKGKDEYTHKQVTSQEVDTEIEKAKNFKPKLKKLYFATTATKDASIEEYIRIKNAEHIEAGLFEVYLWSWEDIVGLIDENKQTHDWYLHEQRFKTTQSIKVTFSCDTEVIVIIPKFHRKSIVLTSNDRIGKLLSLADKFRERIKEEINESYVGFQIKIHNTGNEIIEDYQLKLKFSGNVDDLKKTNVTSLEPVAIYSRTGVKLTTSINSENKTIDIQPFRPLVSDDDFISDEIFLKPFPNNEPVYIEWKLLSRNFKDEGVLVMQVEPLVKNIKEYRYNIGEEEGTEENAEIIDYIKVVKASN